MDGNITEISDVTSVDSDANNSDDSIDATEFDTEDEAFPEVIPANLSPIFGQNVNPGQPLSFDVDLEADLSSSLPLCLLLNSRSVFNKSDNLREMLHQIGPPKII